MRLPWISRTSHEEMTGLLSSQIAELKEERKILLDRLATLGLGGPLFSLATTESDPEVPEPEELIDPDAEFKQLRALYGHRPNKLADELTRRARHRGASGINPVAMIPKVQAAVTAALDEAEQNGKRQAIS